jgi:cyclopropane fatty-acyl-phospholipid synthase-like methyltransferase
MLARLQATLRARSITDVTTTRADVLRLDVLPASWRDYDLVVSASMLEYIPKERFAEALAGLRGLLAPGGRFILFITRRNWLTLPMIGRWWQGNRYDKWQVSQGFREAEFQNVAFGSFPLSARHLSLWGYVVEASR